MQSVKIEGLHWELTVLSKAILYANLSNAAQNIGISQSQLSRIIGKLEEELKIKLLDRTVPRKSGWLPIALHIAKVYQNGTRRLDAELRSALEMSEPKQLQIGTLEGFIPQATDLVSKLYQTSSIHTIQVDIYDLRELESRFTNGELDLIITIRMPGKKKYTFSHSLGFQNLNYISKPSAISDKLTIYSSFEYAMKGDEHEKKLKNVVSNSLEFRKYFIDKVGGSGWLPSDIFPSKKELLQDSSHKPVAVTILGSESFSSELWKKVTVDRA